MQVSSTASIRKAALGDELAMLITSAWKSRLNENITSCPSQATNAIHASPKTAWVHESPKTAFVYNLWAEFFGNDFPLKSFKLNKNILFSLESYRDSAPKPWLARGLLLELPLMPLMGCTNVQWANVHFATFEKNSSGITCLSSNEILVALKDSALKPLLWRFLLMYLSLQVTFRMHESPKTSLDCNPRVASLPRYRYTASSSSSLRQSLAKRNWQQLMNSNLSKQWSLDISLINSMLIFHFKLFLTCCK